MRNSRLLTWGISVEDALLLVDVMDDYLDNIEKLGGMADGDHRKLTSLRNQADLMVRMATHGTSTLPRSYQPGSGQEEVDLG